MIARKIFGKGLQVAAHAVLVISLACPAASAQDSEQESSQSQHPAVVVTAPRDLDRHTLEHVVVPKFVRSHATATESIDQLARWIERVCPEVKGLTAMYNLYVTDRILSVAERVGAPRTEDSGCKTNVEVLFTADPKGELDYVMRKKKGMLGGSFGHKPSKTFDHPIQAWYVTATRSYVAPTTPLNGTTYDHGIIPAANGNADIFVQSFTTSGLPPKNERQNDTPQGQDLLRGQAGSLLGAGLTSEFVNVMIIIDSKQVSKYSLTAIADYIGMLALTRTSLDDCSVLPSVIDLLSKDCQEGRPTPTSLTNADTAYLRALYSANLGFNLNIEMGEVRQRMSEQIEAQ